MIIITGSFYQPQAGFGIGCAPTGAVAEVHYAAISVFFSGFLQQVDEEPYGGFMLDMDGGQADLINGFVTSTRIAFEKRYVKQSHYYNPDRHVLYELRKSEEYWTGVYKVIDAERTTPLLKGPVRCVVTEVDEEVYLRDLTAYAKELGDTNYFGS